MSEKETTAVPLVCSYCHERIVGGIYTVISSAPDTRLHQHCVRPWFSWQAREPDLRRDNDTSNFRCQP